MKNMCSPMFGRCLIQIFFLETVKLSQAMNGLLICTYYNLTNLAAFFHRLSISKIFRRYTCSKFYLQDVSRQETPGWSPSHREITSLLSLLAPARLPERESHNFTIN